MTFSPSIPGSSDIISVSQGQIQTNFSQANTIFDTDHYAFDNATAANRGKTRQTSFIDQAGNPASSSGEIRLWNNGNDLYFRRQSSASVIRLTSGGVSAAQSGYSFLPGGVVL